SEIPASAANQHAITYERISFRNSLKKSFSTATPDYNNNQVRVNHLKPVPADPESPDLAMCAPQEQRTYNGPASSRSDLAKAARLVGHPRRSFFREPPYFTPRAKNSPISKAAASIVKKMKKVITWARVNNGWRDLGVSASDEGKGIASGGIF